MPVTPGTYHKITCDTCDTVYETDGGPMLFATRTDAVETVRAEWAANDDTDPYGPHGWGFDGGGDIACDACLRRLRCANTYHPWTFTHRPGTVRCERCGETRKHADADGDIAPAPDPSPTPAGAPF